MSELEELRRRLAEMEGRVQKLEGQMLAPAQQVTLLGDDGVIGSVWSPSCTCTQLGRLTLEGGVELLSRYGNPTCPTHGDRKD